MDDIVKQARDHAAEVELNSERGNDPTAALLVSLADEVVRLREALGRVRDEANTVCGDWRESASMIDSICIAALAGEQGDDGHD